ncbi:MAG: TonB-dependent receptor plug domain-containing protein [Flavisolibacter sp.]|jgi:iron complex outermembrane receptor protein|nr:TonB-dependent receptor plug domain-containing protein [Flavisolibacter sp.]
MKRTVIFFLGMFAFHAHSQQTDTTLLEPVEVRATRASATAPFAKTNLDKETIKKQNLGQDLPFLLNQTPSVVVNSDAGTGFGYTGIRIRGTDATRINVTLNGIPYNDAESQGTFFVNLPDFASSVSSIQVQRGVGTSTNGASAFGATLNISTIENNLKPYAEINNSYGSFNSVKNTIKLGTGLINNHFLADLRLSKIISNGYVDRASSDLKALYFSGAYLAEKSSFRFNFFTGSEKTYQAWYGIAEADLKTNRRINYAGTERPGAPYDNETDNYRQDHYQLFFTHHLNAQITLNTGLFYTKGKGYYEQYKANRKYSDYNIASLDGSSTRTDLVRQLWLDNDFYGNIFSLQYRSGGTDLVFGGAITSYDGLHYGKIKWAEKGFTANGNWYENKARKNDFNIYGKWQQQIAVGLQVFTDLQYRNVGYSVNGFRDHPLLNVKEEYSFFNPKIGLSYSKNKWLLYSSYSIGRKEPNRDDFEAGLNEIPKPEHLHDIEIGIENRNNKRLFAANIYYMKYRDQLVLTGKINDVGAYTRTNIDDSYRLGIELQSSANINKWFSFAANLTLSRNKVRDFTEYLDDYDNGGQVSNSYTETDIAYSPAVTGAATIMFQPADRWSFDLIQKYVGSQYLDNTSNDQRKLDAFFTNDLRSVYSLKIKKPSVDLVFQVNNLLNTLYEPNGYTFSYFSGNELVTENFYFPMAGRNFMAAINIRIN